MRHASTPKRAKRATLAMSAGASPSEPLAVAAVRRFVWTRYAVFVGMALTYATYVALRATFTYASPVLAGALGLSLESVGYVSSAFPLAYGMSRLFTGVLVDAASPRLALGLGLFLAGLANAAMGNVTSVSALALLWGLNGLVQGLGAGASAKMLTSWFSRKERGFWWALWSTSANVGGFVAPLVCGWLATNHGFRAGMLVPGVFAVSFALLVTPLLRNSPAEAGLVAPWAAEAKMEEAAAKAAAPSGSTEDEAKPTWREAFVEGVVKNKTIWILAVAYFFVYLVRSGMKSWLHFWLLEAKLCSVAEAAYRVSGMEIGGIFGTFSAGVVSDAFDGRRVAVTIAYLLGLALSLVATWAVPAGRPLADFAAISCLGFMINGPQMLIGLIGAEVSKKRVLATATGVLGWISYLGASVSGFPLSRVIRGSGWNAYFGILLGSTLVAAAMLAPLWRLKGAASAPAGARSNVREAEQKLKDR